MIIPCKACETALSSRNKSGYCQKCYPEFQAIHKRGTRTVVVHRPKREVQKGLLKQDADYRERMEAANAQFVARLVLARAA